MTSIIKEFHDNNPTYSYNNASSGGKDGMGSVASRDNHINMSITGTKSQTKFPMLTLLDSGVSDHCFTDHALFSVYSLLDNPTTGFGAGLDSTFYIIGKGNIRFESIVDGKPQQITLNRALHTSDLRSNLILVSKLGEREASMSFNNRLATVIANSEVKILTVT